MKNNIRDIIILILFFIIMFQTCQNKKQKKSIHTIEHFRDTTEIKISGDTTINNIFPTKIIPYVYTSKDTLYIPDTTNIEIFKIQYYALRDSLLSTKIYDDTFKIATLGDARIKTIVFNNAIKEQKFNYNIKYPVIKDCVIVTAPSKNQMFLGIGVQGNKQELSQFSGHILFKNRKDNILGFQVGVPLTGSINYGINTFWKIK